MEQMELESILLPGVEQGQRKQETRKALSTCQLVNLSTQKQIN